MDHYTQRRMILTSLGQIGGPATYFRDVDARVSNDLIASPFLVIYSPDGTATEVAKLAGAIDLELRRAAAIVQKFTSLDGWDEYPEIAKVRPIAPTLGGLEFAGGKSGSALLAWEPWGQVQNFLGPNHSARARNSLMLLMTAASLASPLVQPMLSQASAPPTCIEQTSSGAIDRAQVFNMRQDIDVVIQGNVIRSTSQLRSTPSIFLGAGKSAYEVTTTFCITVGQPRDDERH